MTQTALLQATECGTCIPYLDARIHVLFPHLVAKADRVDASVASVLVDYMDQVHDRHTVAGPGRCGLPLDVPGYTWTTYRSEAGPAWRLSKDPEVAR